MNKFEKHDSPIISIITPVYNVEDYLDRCVKSILNQTFKNFELILIDDGSSDESGHICDKWKDVDDRIVVIHQENMGAGAARNAGLRIARGEYIGFVDSDDWIDSFMYEILYNTLLHNTDADIAECETNWTKNYRAKAIHDSKLSDKYLSQVIVKNRTEIFESFFRIHGGKSNYGIYTKLIHRRILTNFNFVEGTISEDVMASYYFYLHCSKVAQIPLKLYNYFQNQAGVTRCPVTNKDFEYIEAFLRIRDELKTCWPEMYNYAHINFIRANFTILCKMKLYGFDKTNNVLSQKYTAIKKIVRNNFSVLFSLNMPLNRKILLIYVCI